jgi:DnaJ-class molecular chaperone
MEGLKNGAGGAGMDDIFSMFMGGGRGGAGGAKQKAKVKPITR